MKSSKRGPLDAAFEKLSEKRYMEALTLFQNSPVDDKNKLIGIARCYQGMGRYDDALRVYSGIPGGEHDKQVQLSLACCYEKMGRYGDALETYQRIPNREYDHQVQQSICRVLYEMGDTT